MLANRRLLLSMLLSAALCGVYGPGVTGQEPLKGTVEESGVEPSKAPPVKPVEEMPKPVLRQRLSRPDSSAALKGAARDNAAGAEDEDADLQKMTAHPDPHTGVLKGSATRDGSGLRAMDPDADDAEMMIEWDKWRNRLLFAIQSGMQENINNPGESNLRWDPEANAMVPKFPLGTVAWFYCQVTPDRRILNLKLTHSSGYPGYDRAVMEAVRNLEGSSILRYPKGSRRTVVTQEAGIKTATSSEYRYFKFGDVEHQRIAN